MAIGVNQYPITSAGLLDAIKKGLETRKLSEELPYVGKGAKATAEYKEAMAKYLSNPYQMQRFMTPIGKLLNEQQLRQLGVDPAMANNLRQAGFVEGSGQPGAQGQVSTGSPGVPQGQSAYDPYGLEIQKHTTDPNTRQRNLLVKNIEKTLSTIDPKALTHYSGLPGMKDKMIDMLSSATGIGTPSEAYQPFLEASRNAKQLASQVRQFYGDSIQPSVKHELEMLTNPSSWQYNPAQAEKLFNKYAQLLGYEAGTYQEALNFPHQSNTPQQPPQQGPSPYSEQNLVNQPQAQQEGMAQVDIGAEGAGSPDGQQVGEPTEADIAFTAKKYNMTPDEVKKYLGIK